jgi:hypothetical protein
MTDPRMTRAIERFDAIHAEDPRAGSDGPTLAHRYHHALADWVRRLLPQPSTALWLAAHCQHIRRWTMPRTDFPTGLSGYRRWRSSLARMHGDIAEEVLREAGFDDAVCARVRALLLKKGLGADAEVQHFEDAICLTFLQLEAADFAAKHDDDKVIDILRKTLAKMSPAGQAAARELGATLAPRLQTLIARATGAS